MVQRHQWSTLATLAGERPCCAGGSSARRHAYRARAHRLIGIGNGIDELRFDPQNDIALPAAFSAEDLAGKDVCRLQLLRESGLEAPPAGLLCAAIGRLAGQKGWDIIVNSIEPLLARGASLVFLGDGAPWIAEALIDAGCRHPRRVRFSSTYDEAFARRIYGGADVMLVPSRFEPCGLVQLIAQRYGTVPVAHATGGLVDTIHDPWLSSSKKDTDAFDPWRRATGVFFSPLNAENLVLGVDRVAKLAAAGHPARSAKAPALARGELGWASAIVGRRAR